MSLPSYRANVNQDVRPAEYWLQDEPCGVLTARLTTVEYVEDVIITMYVNHLA